MITFNRKLLSFCIVFFNLEITYSHTLHGRKRAVQRYWIIKCMTQNVIHSYSQTDTLLVRQTNEYECLCVFLLGFRKRMHTCNDIMRGFRDCYQEPLIG